jgi:predicted PurR-regulated permease PerM
MTARPRLLFWLGLLVAMLTLVMIFRAILLPFVAGMILAYLLDPVVDRLNARGLARWLAASLVLGAFAVVFVLALALLAPLVQAQVARLVVELPSYVESWRGSLEPLLRRLTEQVDPDAAKEFRDALLRLATALPQWLLGFAGDLWRSGAALFNLVGLIVVTPVVAWYLMRDWDLLVARIDAWLPRAHAEVIREQFGRIDDTLAGFVRGQAMVCLILAAGYGLALELAGLNFGLVVGLIAGVISFIPFVGSAIGLVLSVILAVVQFDDWWRVALIAGIFLVGQAIEGNFLSPKLIGDRVGLHPVWILFALLAGAALFGFLGVLLAVPAAAVIGVLVRFALAQYLGSGFYRGGGRAEP